MIDSVARQSWTGLAALVSLMSFTVASADSGPQPTAAFPVKNGTIAFALTSLRWATYLKPDAPVDCPDGVNQGPREQFAALFPNDGQTRTLADTQLKREVQNWFPTTAPDYFAFREPRGPHAIGLNLDGRNDPEDFTSLEGEPGIDNQLYRALGCINSYRDANGTNDSLNSAEILTDRYNRLLIEINGVTSLENSEQVEVMVYRGLDPLRTDAGGKRVLPGQTQRIDIRWGAKFIQRLQGKIVNGVLITEPHDLTFPWSVFNVPTDEYVREARLRLNLTAETADGLIGGYADIETWYLQLMKSQSTHCQSYGQLASMSLYKAMRRLADAYPDPKTGANTAISSALRATFTQVYILPESKAALAAVKGTFGRAAPYEGPPSPRMPADDALFLPVGGAHLQETSRTESK
jgi:hypothetical protein